MISSLAETQALPLAAALTLAPPAAARLDQKVVLVAEPAAVQLGRMHSAAKIPTTAAVESVRTDLGAAAAKREAAVDLAYRAAAMRWSRPMD